MFNITEMTKTAELVKEWAKAREFETGATYEGQFYKLIEEFGELVTGLNKGKQDIIIDSVGDMLVVLSNMYLVSGQDFLHVLRAANGIIGRNILKSDKNTLAITMFLGHFANIIFHGSIEKCHRMIDDVAIDILLALHNICEDHKIDIAECFNIAYNEIKDRDGKMIDGKFIKSEDL